MFEGIEQIKHTHLWDSQVVKLQRDKQIRRNVEAYSMWARKSNWTENIANKTQLYDCNSDCEVCDWIAVPRAHDNETKK